jgi:hypothetical protein
MGAASLSQMRSGTAADSQAPPLTWQYTDHQLRLRLAGFVRDEEVAGSKDDSVLSGSDSTAD